MILISDSPPSSFASSGPADPDFDLSSTEVDALERIASDMGIPCLESLAKILLRDLAAAELDDSGWQQEAVAEWLQHRLELS